jgi:uncharacterized membrane protein YagU involved in acid resistance
LANTKENLMKPLPILKLAFFAGSMDIVAAFLQQYFLTGKFADKLFHYLAGGLMGLSKSMKGGAEMIALGIGIHYFWAFVYTILFIYLARLLPKFNLYLIGVVYGIFLGLLMAYFVLPMSQLPLNPINLKSLAQSCVILALFFGLPLAWGVKKFRLSIDSST